MMLYYNEVIGGFYSNWFYGTIKISNKICHIEPTRKYSKILTNAGLSIISNAFYVDMTIYKSNNTFRSKQFMINENEKSSSFSEFDNK
ncbi:unnamed protein product [Rotaria sp. Silwood2]|nr:unnamed protein product [Rotaria sp. Silwood2]